MTTLNIDRLTLNLPALSQSDGQQLARQIAQGLASGVITSQTARDSPNIHVTIPANSNPDVDWLGVCRTLKKTLVFSFIHNAAIAALGA